MDKDDENDLNNTKKSPCKWSVPENSLSTQRKKCFKTVKRCLHYSVEGRWICSAARWGHAAKQTLMLAFKSTESFFLLRAFWELQTCLNLEKLRKEKESSTASLAFRYQHPFCPVANDNNELHKSGGWPTHAPPAQLCTEPPQHPIQCLSACFTLHESAADFRRALHTQKVESTSGVLMNQPPGKLSQGCVKFKQ